MVRTTKELIQTGVEIFPFYTASIPLVRLPTYLSNGSFTGEKRREREHDHQVVTKLGMLEAISIPPFHLYDAVFNGAQWCLFHFVLLL
jgi:hypothetical protein